MNVSKHPSWSQVTLTEEKPDCGIDYTFTPQERDRMLLAVLEKEDFVRQFGRATPGLEVGYVPASDLTDAELAALGMEVAK